MKLPIFQSDSKDMTLMQNKWSSILNALLAKPICDGQLLQNISLSNGTTIVNHLLQRKLTGWFIVGINGAATIYDNQASNQTPELTLSLTSNAAVKVFLWVF